MLCFFGIVCFPLVLDNLISGSSKGNWMVFSIGLQNFKTLNNVNVEQKLS